MPENITGHPRVSGEILSITVNSRIVPSLKGKPVKKPNWEAGVDLADGPYSQRPGVFEIDNPRFKGLTVTLQVSGLNAHSRPLLAGKLKCGSGSNERSITFAGEIDNTGDIQTVSVVPAAEPENFIWLYGDMEWFLEFANGSAAPIGRPTRVEMSWIYSYPGRMFHRRGVWIEVLRLLGDICKKGAAPPTHESTGNSVPDRIDEKVCFFSKRSRSIRTNNETKDDVIKEIVTYCHAGAGLSYDSYYGSCYFVDGSEGGLFKLRAFLEKVIAICNCYDQAGAVQTLLGALGIEVDWLYMYPFGYIHVTNLTGRQVSNNPFFSSTGDSKEKEIVPKNDPNRTGFGNHAFCGIHRQGQIYILDSCVGPHLGDETTQEYIGKSIDSGTVLYGSDTISRSGTAEDIRKYPGILYVDVPGCDLLTGSRKETGQDEEDRRVALFKKRIGFEECGRQVAPGTGVVCPWEEILDDSALDSGKCIFDNIHFGCNMSVLERIYKKNNERLRIEIFISNKGIEAAKKRLLDISAATTSARIPFAESVEKPGHLCVTAGSHRRKRVICVFYNVCFVVEAHDSSQDALAVLRRLCETAEDYVVQDLSQYVPRIENVAVTPGSQRIKTGEPVSVVITPDPDQDPENNLGLVFHTGGDSLIFEHEEFYSPEENNYRLEFTGRSPGTTGVFPILANWQNLLCTTREVGITVSEAN